MKVLIISHLPVATQNNMGKTFLSLFSQLRREELCQLYIYPAIPDVDRCASYYRVTDKEILASLLGRGRAGGEIDRSRISGEQGLYEHAEDETFYRNRKNKSPVRRLLRDAMWQMADWYHRGLADWLDREQPTCVFVAPGTARFVYNIALRIAEKRNIPIVSYVCDEYYFVEEPGFGLERLRVHLLQSRIARLIERSAHLIVICEELKKAYGARFRLPITTVMTGTNYAIADGPAAGGAPQSICYFGNIRCNRYLSLAQIGRELDAINRERGTSYRLKIYSSEKDPAILQVFSGIASVELCGFVSGEAFTGAFMEAGLLLHVEAFDPASIELVRHSVSTKIADSLASGIPLLAYGPETVASMQHLIRNGCAVTATDEGQLRQALLRALTDEDCRKTAAENGLKTAHRYHDSVRAGAEMRKILETVSDLVP